MAEKCLDVDGKVLSDAKYELVGYQISQFDYYEENGLLEILDELPLDEKYIDYVQMQ